MIVLDPEQDCFHWLREPGSYEWTYFDGLSDDHEFGIVAIWFRGCPMSPYYTAAIDRGRAVSPDDYCAFTFSIYRHGRRIYSFYREGPGAPFQAEGADARYGSNSVRAGTGKEGHRSFLVYLDQRQAWGRGRMRGEIEISAGPQHLGGPGVPYVERPNTHYWVPAMLDARFTAKLDLWNPGRGTRKLRFSGRAYHDRNFGTAPLHHLRADWHWGRVHAGSRTFVYFGAFPDAGAQKREDGSETFGRLLLLEENRLIASADAWEISSLSHRKHWATLPMPRELSGVSPDGAFRFRTLVRHAVDSGPFYHRLLSDIEVVTDAGQLRGTGITEYLRPPRLGVAAFRPFVKFRTRREE